MSSQSGYPTALPQTSASINTAVPVTAVLRLAASLDLTAADALHSELRTYLSHNIQLSVDGSEVERVSTACLQVLAAAAADLRARGGVFRLNPMSNVLIEAIHDLGLRDALGVEYAG